MSPFSQVWFIIENLSIPTDFTEPVKINESLLTFVGVISQYCGALLVK